MMPTDGLLCSLSSTMGACVVGWPYSRVSQLPQRKQNILLPPAVLPDVAKASWLQQQLHYEIAIGTHAIQRAGKQMCGRLCAARGLGKNRLFPSRPSGRLKWAGAAGGAECWGCCH